MKGRGLFHSRRAQRGERAARRARGTGWLASGAVVVAAGITFTIPATGPGAIPTLYGAAVELAGTTLGVGGTFEGYALTIPWNFYGTIVPPGDTYQPVPYPAIIGFNIPVVSDLPGLSDMPYWPQTMSQSVAKGVAFTKSAIAALPAGEETTIIGMSQGAMVVETVRADLANDPNYTANAQNYHFIMLGNPYRPNGGMLTRFESFNGTLFESLFGIPYGRPGPADSPFPTTDYSNQYDPVSDFPAYFNPLSIANATVGFVFQHAVPGYFFDDPNNPNRVETTVGNTTYVLLPQHLPLLYPFHVAASFVGLQRFVDFAEPILRVFVEMGYDRTADPSQVKEFSFVTPPEKFAEAMQQLPGAIAEALAILAGKPYVPPAPPQPIVASPLAPSMPAIASTPRVSGPQADAKALSVPAVTTESESTATESETPAPTLTRRGDSTAGSIGSTPSASTPVETAGSIGSQEGGDNAGGSLGRVSTSVDSSSAGTTNREKRSSSASDTSESDGEHRDQKPATSGARTSSGHDPSARAGAGDAKSGSQNDSSNESKSAA